MRFEAFWRDFFMKRRGALLVFDIVDDDGLDWRGGWRRGHLFFLRFAYWLWLSGGFALFLRRGEFDFARGLIDREGNMIKKTVQKRFMHKDFLFILKGVIVAKRVMLALADGFVLCDVEVDMVICRCDKIDNV